MNLVCDDLTCDGEKVADLHHKRWKVEAFHKSLKSNAGLAKSPTRRVRTQQNHVFMSMAARVIYAELTTLRAAAA